MPQFSSLEGRMVQAVRAFDWASTPLGRVETWPVSLLTILRLMLAQRQPICLFWGPDLTMIYNDAYAPFLGLKEPGALGKPFRVIWSDIWTEVKPFVDEALAGKGTYHEEMPLVMLRNGYEEMTYWTFSYSPVYDDTGEVAGLVNVPTDATPAVRARRNYETMQRELVHRIKNTLAVTNAVVSSTLRHAASIEDARDTVRARMNALAQSQDFLNHKGDHVDVEQVVRGAIVAHLDDPTRATITGTPVRVASEQAVGLSLALYELATNALKYGALLHETGSIHIRWAHEPDGSFRFEWEESGGPEVTAPKRTGFGSRLTNVIVASYFYGTGKTHYHASGLRFELNGRVERAEIPEPTPM